jgi:ABC-type polysaccharide transport system permease subunit
LPSKIEFELIFSYLPMATLIIAFRDKNEEKECQESI